jgi:hypothetical protein
MRRATVLVSLAVLGVFVSAVPAAAQTFDFDAMVRASFGIRNSIVCPPDLDCGTASVDGFGKATRTFAITGFVPAVPPGCDLVTGIEHMTLDSDGSTLDLAVTAALCYPGASHSAPDDQAPSKGDPFKATGTFEVSDGTGVFAGAGGSGTLTAIGAGDAIVINYAGTITLGS